MSLLDFMDEFDEYEDDYAGGCEMCGGADNMLVNVPMTTREKKLIGLEKARAKLKANREAKKEADKLKKMKKPAEGVKVDPVQVLPQVVKELEKKGQMTKKAGDVVRRCLKCPKNYVRICVPKEKVKQMLESGEAKRPLRRKKTIKSKKGGDFWSDFGKGFNMVMDPAVKYGLPIATALL